jgi:hypothetical protein
MTPVKAQNRDQVEQGKVEHKSGEAREERSRLVQGLRLVSSLSFHLSL